MTNPKLLIPGLGPRSLLLGTLLFAAACSTPSSTTTRTPPAHADVAYPPAAPALRAAPAQDTKPLARAEARHLLNRFTFGPRSTDLEVAERTSARAWMDWQLEPESIDDAGIDERLSAYRTVLLPPAEVHQAYLRPLRRVPSKSKQGFVEKQAIDSRSLLEHAQMVQFVRQLASERQVYEIMVDFWFNHFNIYFLKEPGKLLVTDYIERAIRPHALGRFEELLIATARHPAMLVYLDNYLSTAATTKVKRKGTPTGITENYAREVLELHTLGVHGGYTQRDVIEVARILTGWTIRDLRGKSYAFAFKPEMHDFGSKLVLGVSYPPKRGEPEGLELLKRLASHPSTARHLATKLCIRFVADTPPPHCVDQLSKVYLKSNGDIRSVLMALIGLPDFWASEHQQSKLKSPNLYMVSAYRVLGIEPRGAGEHAKLNVALGEPKLLQPAPTGYLDDAAAWSSTAGILGRMNFALSVSNRATPKSPAAIGDGEIVARINQSLFAGLASESTLDVLRTQVAEQTGTRQKLRTAAALALGSPDFQYH